MESGMVPREVPIPSSQKGPLLMAQSAPPQGATQLFDVRPTASPLTVPPADHDLTVIIPAYNEEKRLPWTLAQLAVFLERVGRGLSGVGGRRRQHRPHGRADARSWAAMLDAAPDAAGRQGPGGADRHAPRHRPRAGLHRRRSALPAHRPAAGLRVDSPRPVRRGLRRPRHRGVGESGPPPAAAPPGHLRLPRGRPPAWCRAR